MEKVTGRKFKKDSSGKSFIRRAKITAGRKSFFRGMEYSIFVSATKEIQS